MVRITAEPGETFIDRMIALVEGAKRQKTPNEIALNILLAGLTIIFLMVVVTLQPFAIYSQAPQTVVVLTALLVCLAPTTIGALLSAIGIAGMDRLVQRNVLAMSRSGRRGGRRRSTLLLDKTGTITFGNRMAAEFIPVAGVDEPTLAAVALLSSLADETPEGRSIVALAEDRSAWCRSTCPAPSSSRSPPRPACRASSGRAAPSARAPPTPCSAGWSSRAAPCRGPRRIVAGIAETAARRWWSPTATAVLGVIYLKDTVKPGISAAFDDMRAMGIRTVMITGDNPITAATIAA